MNEHTERVRPNIVFITTDTQGRDMLSCYTDRPGVDTPALDALSRDGVLFENTFAACPTCTPARGTWYTGVHPNRHGAVCNGLAVSRQVPMLAETLRDHGYRCDHIGKWHVDAAGYEGAGRADGGFEEDTWYDLSSFYDEVGRDGPNTFGGWNRGLDDVEYCFGHRVADRAISLLRDRSREDSSPFFLAVEFDEPHGPYICPPPFRERYGLEEIYVPETLHECLRGKPVQQQRYAAYLRSLQSDPGSLLGYYPKYYNCNSYADYEIGRILDTIREIADPNTIVIFTSDHGDHLGSFGLGPKGPTMYDTAVAVPLIVWSPLIRGTRREGGLVSSLDIWATIVDCAGAGEWLAERRVSDGYEGRSLRPVLEETGESDRDAVFMEYNRFGIQFDQCDGLSPIRCIRTSEWKLAVNLFDRDELYHLSDDPEEIENLIDNPGTASIRDELHDRILEHQSATQDLLRSPQWRERPWRERGRHTYVGFTPTGARETWEEWEWRI